MTTCAYHAKQLRHDESMSQNQRIMHFVFIFTKQNLDPVYAHLEVCNFIFEDRGSDRGGLRICIGGLALKGTIEYNSHTFSHHILDYEACRQVAFAHSRA